MILTPPLRVGDVEVVSVDKEHFAIHSVVHIACRPQDTQTPEVTAKINEMLKAAGDYLMYEGWIEPGKRWKNQAVLYPMKPKE